MKKHASIVALALLLLLTTKLLSQQKQNSKSVYIERFKGIAAAQMQKSGVPSSIILAQACLESGYGNSSLTTKGKNHFGIKCHNSWTGDKIYHDDDAKGECFRVYKKDEDSFTDHSDFLRYNKRYSSLFDLDPTDYKAWAHGLKKAGYATNPKYAELLIQTIEDNKLYLYDKGVAINVPSPSQLDAIDLENFTIQLNRKIYSRNGVKYVIANKGDTYDALAAEFKLRTYQLVKYNDLGKYNQVYEGQELYIKAKRSRADKNHPVHIVQDGETMQQISQLYGIKLKSLLHYNKMNNNEEAEVGQELFLRNKMNR